jgi:RNA polymerase sigma-70 factor (ECF subfamily)
VTTEPDLLAAAFSQARPRLVRVAYAIIGSHSEAEDVVADCWFRLVAADKDEPVRDVEAWAVVAVSRMALDVLRSARVRRERYVGPWLPEPLVEDLSGTDPADRVTLDESVSMALLVVLERLSPAERTSFLLHDVFGMSFTDVAGVVGRSPAAVRQLASRARQHVDGGRPRFPPTPAQQEELVTAFAAACAGGDLEGLVTLLDPDVVWRADGGGKVTATRQTAHGADEVARWLLGFMRHPPTLVRLATVNGGPGLVVRDGGGVLTVVSFTIDRGRITALDVIRNPDKLAAVRAQAD